MFETFVRFLFSETTVTNHFHSHEVVRLTGITARQLQWWDEQGIVVPAREGHSRLYSQADLTEVAVICQLRCSLLRVKSIIVSLLASLFESSRYSAASAAAAAGRR